MTTFDLAADWLALIDAIDDAGGELTPELEARLAALEAASADKLDALANVVEHYRGVALVARAAKERFAAKEQAAERAAGRVLARAKALLEAGGQKRVTTAGGWVFAVCANGGKPPLAVTCDPAELPPEFQRRTVAADLDAIRAALEAGAALPFASVGERGTHLRLK